jgi:hypothetical protein
VSSSHIRPREYGELIFGLANRARPKSQRIVALPALCGIDRSRAVRLIFGKVARKRPVGCG